MGELTIRELERNDFAKGFLNALDTLRETSTMGEGEALEIFEKIKLNPNHIIVVAEIDGKIVGSTTILIEPKFIHRGGIVGPVSYTHLTLPTTPYV